MLTKNQGFTLVELVIALLVVVILARIGLSAYNSYALQTQRSDGTSAIMAVQAAEEKYRTNNTTYGTLSQLSGVSSTTDQGFYTIGVSNNTASNYKITATATTKNSQNTDSTCATITLTKSGATTTQAPTVCWQ